MANAGVSPAAASHSIDPGLLKRLEDFVDAEASEKIDIDSLAAVAAMSVATFTRALKQTTGRTPYQYCMALRVEKARNLIISTRLSLAEIAYQAGFSSQSHMTDVFRSKLGATPGAIRKSTV